jgi:hypothetical protein
MDRERRLAGSPPSFAESPLAAVWERAADGRHALAAGHIACIRETRREVEERRPRGLRLSLGKPVPEDDGDGPESFWDRLLADGRIAPQRAV